MRSRSIAAASATNRRQSIERTEARREPAGDEDQVQSRIASKSNNNTAAPDHSTEIRPSTGQTNANGESADVNGPVQSNGESKAKKPTAALGHTNRRPKVGVGGQGQSISAPKAIGTAAEPDSRFNDPIVLQIKEIWPRRQAWHRAEKSLTLVAKSFCRRQVGMAGKNDKAGKAKADALFERVEAGEETGDIMIVCLPLLSARAQIRPHREACDKILAKLAKQLPVAYVVEQTPGFSYNTLASIAGEAGDLSAYRSLRGLWKYLGVGLVDGEIQRRKKDAIAAKNHKYSPARRSVIWNVGSSLIGFMQKGPRPRVGENVHEREDLSLWQIMFLDRLRYEVERDPDHRRPDKKNKNGEMMESFSRHAANRARRHVEKQFLKYLRLEWQSTVLTQTKEASAVTHRK
jgi:hypothetical protein